MDRQMDGQTDIPCSFSILDNVSVAKSRGNWEPFDLICGDCPIKCNDEILVRNNMHTNPFLSVRTEFALTG